MAYDRTLGVTGLVDAAAGIPYREIRPRLTAGFAHRPLRARIRAAYPAGGIEPAMRKLYLASRRLIRDRNERPPSSLHAAGIAQTALNSGREACKGLEAAAKAETRQASAPAAIARLRDAPLLADLSAAYYLRGLAENRTELLLESIEAASRAIALDSALLPAAFNRALAIEAVHLPTQAIAAWDDYLRLDSTSDWAAEAREHVSTLFQRARKRETSTSDDQRSPEGLATRIEAELLPAWADAFRKRDAQAVEHFLRELETATSALRSCCGDTFHTRAFAAVRTAARTNRKVALRLAIAHQRYRDARNLYARNDTSAALPVFEASRDAFRSAGDIFVMKPWKYVAACALYLGDSASALREMSAARASCETLHCPPAVIAHLEWVQGLALGREGSPQAAIAYYSDALRGFEEGREHDNVASVRALIAENQEFLGASEDAWPNRLAAMERASMNGTLDRIYLAFNGAADAALRHGHPTSARLFQDIVVQAARHEANTVLLADSLLWRALILRELHSAAAHRDLDEAARLAINVSDDGRRNRLLANISAAKAQIEPPAAALESLNTALTFFEKSDDHYRLAELYAARAAAKERLAKPAAAEADYSNCIRVLESLRRGISEAAVRERFFSSGSTVFDRAVGHLWRTGRRDEAFTLAEQSRGRELNRGAALPALTVRELSSTLHTDEALVEYAVLQDRLAIWVIRSNCTSTLEASLSEESLEREVASMQTALESRQAFDASLASMSARIYAPLSNRVRDARRLIIIPNKALRRVPFSALRDETTGRYLVEDHELIVAPSASAWAAATRRDRVLRRPGPQSIFVASFLSGDLARNLPVLQHVRQETDGLGALYPRMDTLDGNRATPERVLESASHAYVVHIAAHIVQDEEHPEYSSIVLAPGRKGRDLYARNVAVASLRSTRFLFLSSCGTSARSPHNDAPLTLPESFLSAGVPLVVASLRPVDDQATVAFALALHRAFAISGDAVASLRKAQLQCLASQDHNDPRFWSSWIAIGGAA